MSSLKSLVLLVLLAISSVLAIDDFKPTELDPNADTQKEVKSPELTPEYLTNEKEENDQNIKSAVTDEDAYSKADFENEKVAGGVSVAIERFPYQVSIRVANITVCGGFILAPSWIMTAAHCIDGAEVELITVRAGSGALNFGGTLYNALTYVVHSLYNVSKNNDYDFGLVQINGTFTFGPTVKTISIPSQSKFLPFLKSIVLAGWGVTAENNPVSQELKAVSIKIIPHALCKLLYTGTATITERMFCAGKLIFGGRGSCQGDVGGAAVYNNVALGVASFGVTCGNSIFPSVFSSIASVTEWVKGVTGI